MKNLVIVESPTKANTIKGYLGKDYSVESSYGHIRDLPKKGLGVDTDDNFEPHYVIPPSKKKRVSELKKLIKKADTVWLATDEDREGEAIAWHLLQALKIPDKQRKRIVFHEITKEAIEKAISNPRDIDEQLVNAQQARRILDRLVGYKLSPVLWKKVRPGLSAGRVQSAAVRLIVEREREIKDFTPEISFKITGNFKKDGATIEAAYQAQPKEEEAATNVLRVAQKESFTVSKVDKKPGSRSPQPPFTTSTLQQTAARYLGFNVGRTMSLAQNLYESGHITYMRTDSVNLSESAISAAAAFIKKEYGDSYLKTRRFKTKSRGAQEAHEAIRPTKVHTQQAGKNHSEQRLYKLIREQMIASQMSKAKIERTKIDITAPKLDEAFRAKGAVITFDGFTKALTIAKRVREKALPKISEGEVLDFLSAQAIESFSRAPTRFSEGSLVKKLEELGIGRPSTYAPIISTVQNRGYVEQGDKEGDEYDKVILEIDKDKDIEKRVEKEQVGADSNKLYPTSTAVVVTEFLEGHFPDIVDYDFTAEAEEEFDAIAAGEREWQGVIDEFYKQFTGQLEKAEKITRKEATQARKLGIDPETDKPVFARYGRYGPMVQLGEAEDDEKPKFASIPEGESLDDMTLKRALKLLNLPRTVGETADKKEITANYGKYGPYVKVGKTFVSIGPDDDPFSVTEKKARELIKEKQEQDKKRLIKNFEDVKVKRGPYGPYVTNGKKNVSIPKDVDPEKISEKKARDLIKNPPKKKRKKKKK